MQAAKLIGNSPLLTNYAYSCSFFNLNSIYAQSLRWKRKPIWLPTAKTKIFRVPPRPVIPKEEELEILRLYNNYRTYYRSVRKYMVQITKQNEIQLDHSVIEKAEEDDYIKCMELNEEWNKKIAAERKVRLQNEMEARRLRALQTIEYKEEKMKQKRLHALEKIKEAKLLAPTLITRDNIDQAIEEALANVVNHNKALDASGNWHTKLSGATTVKKSENIQIKQ
ncbi:probable 28S ribosomal protein S26, mitochondrial [Nasonia vitripennis]|uniref:Small ribosomal subunit protein mS26 n=1 Tax=Nasonia vitripennis TaxID=7425 RepID=A0A7M7QYE4_NASVI|nr:probable 28S ribosomal protein S26, mitochondrial [Nasonia vitripennis]